MSRTEYDLQDNCSLKTMDEQYGDGSKHKVCPFCGMCIDCGDCVCIK